MSKLLRLLVPIAALVGIFLLFTGDWLEQQPPGIQAEKKIYWNLHNPIDAIISDNTGIANYKVSFLIAEKELLAQDVSPQDKPTSLHIDITPPSLEQVGASQEFTIKITATDISKWNLLKGNISEQTITIIVDRKKPKLSILSKSYGIYKGGSAAVVFNAEDENLKELYIEAGKNRFVPFKFYKEGYYNAIIAWDVQEEDFSPKIVAIDLAGNRSITGIDYFKKNIEYKKSTIPLSDSFVEGKITDLTMEVGETPDPDKIARFKYVNETLRALNTKAIYDVASKSLLQREDFQMLPFYPLKNGAKVADFGDYRTFVKDGVNVSNSYHLGIDFASTANAPIIGSNKGIVIYSDFNGIYGNMLLIDHGMGIGSLYAHCLEFRKIKGDIVEPNDVIAISGKTGLALGDHLHFGITVQGIEARPQEWMDSNWIRLNITDVFKAAKAMMQ